MIISLILSIVYMGQVLEIDPYKQVLPATYSKFLFSGSSQDFIIGFSKVGIDLLKRDGSLHKKDFALSSKFVFSDRNDVVVCSLEAKVLSCTQLSVLGGESKKFDFIDSYPLGYIDGVISLYSRPERKLKAIQLPSLKALASQAIQSEPGELVLFDKERSSFMFSLQVGNTWKTYGLPNIYCLKDSQQLLIGASHDFKRFCGTSDANMESFVEIIPRNSSSQAWAAFDENIQILPSGGRPASAFFTDKSKRVYGYYRKDESNVAYTCMWANKKFMSLDETLNIPSDRYIIYIHDVAEDGTLIVETRNKRTLSEPKFLIAKIP